LSLRRQIDEFRLEKQARFGNSRLLIELPLGRLFSLEHGDARWFAPCEQARRIKLENLHAKAAKMVQDVVFLTQSAHAALDQARKHPPPAT
jgi:hypothetical protein